MAASGASTWQKGIAQSPQIGRAKQGQMKQMSSYVGSPDGGALRLMSHVHGKEIGLCKDTT